jgi:hypothetical protein
VTGLAGGVTASLPSPDVSGWVVVSVVVAAVSLTVAVASLWTTRAFNVRRELAELLQRLDVTRLDLLMWHMDQATRRNLPSDSLERKYIHDLLKGQDAELVKKALGSDWPSLTAHMIDVYYLALRVHAWLSPDDRSFRSLPRSGIRPTTKVRLLNTTFGYRLLKMFLEHRIVACRLRREGKDEQYFTTSYGLFDGRYTTLVTKLYEDLESSGTFSGDMGANLWALPKKYEAVSSDLRSAVPTTPDARDDS